MSNTCWFCGRKEEEAFRDFKERIVKLESEMGNTNIPVEDLIVDKDLLAVPIVVDEVTHLMEDNYLEQCYVNLELFFKLAVKRDNKLFLDSDNTYVAQLDICPVCAVLLNMMKSKKE